MTKKQDNKEGQCPNCKSLNVDYTYTDSDEDSMVRSFTCNDCGCQAHEQFRMKYVETIIDEEWSEIEEECTRCGKMFPIIKLLNYKSPSKEPMAKGERICKKCRNTKEK